MSSISFTLISALMRPQTNGVLERYNGRIKDRLQSYRFQSGEDFDQTILRDITL